MGAIGRVKNGEIPKPLAEGFVMVSPRYAGKPFVFARLFLTAVRRRAAFGLALDAAEAKKLRRQLNTMPGLDFDSVEIEELRRTLDGSQGKAV